MEPDSASTDDDPGGDLQEFQSQGIHLGRGQRGLLEFFSQREHQDVGGDMEQEADLVGPARPVSVPRGVCRPRSYGL
jgi:hypothetical protein